MSEKLTLITWYCDMSILDIFYFYYYFRFYKCFTLKCAIKYFSYWNKCFQSNCLLWIDKVRVMVYNATLNNNLVISWWSVLLVEETGVPEENHQLVASLYYIMFHRVQLAWSGFKLTTLVVIGTGCTCSYKSNYHTITTTTALDELIHRR